MRVLPILTSLALSVVFTATGCDDSDKGKPTKTAKANKSKAPKRAPPAKKAKPDKKETKADAKAEPAKDEPKQDKVIKITAKPGTPEWFVEGFAAFRAGNIDPIVANFAEDIEWEAVGSPIAPPDKGRDAVLKRWEGLLTGIPDMQLHARRIFHQDDLIIAQVLLTGTNKGEFRGIPATDKAVGAEVLAWIWHNKEGQAKKVRIVYSEATLLTQMGKLEGKPIPIPDAPQGDPEVITGETDKVAVKVIKDKYKAGKNAWKVCQEKLCVEGMISHSVAGGTTAKTPEEHEASTTAFYAAFPDMKVKSKDVISFGPDWVVSFVNGKGTHKGDLGPIKATKKKVNLGYSEVAQLEGGKIKETWGYANRLELLAQIGVFETPTKVAKK